MTLAEILKDYFHAFFVNRMILIKTRYFVRTFELL